MSEMELCELLCIETSISTVEAIAIHFGCSFADGCLYSHGLCDMTDEDYDEIMEIREKIEKGEIEYKSNESLSWI